MKVKNQKCIRRLSYKSLWATRKRNVIAIFAIALTTLLFTSLFTILMSLNESYETYNFRQAGGYADGTFKELSEEQVEKISVHPGIREAGERTVCGFCTTGVFGKVPAEVSYMDKNCTKWSYATPTTGREPEKSNEIAMDTVALKLLGVTPELGAKVTIEYQAGDKTNGGFQETDTFILSGYWEYDDLMPVHYINVSKDYVKSMEEKWVASGEKAFRTDLNVMLPSKLNIEQQMQKIDTDLGYDWNTRDQENSARIGVNWGLTASQLNAGMDPELLAAIAAFLLLVIFTGYLIIYNIFQISVTGDIRFYGLLKNNAAAVKTNDQTAGIPFMCGWHSGRTSSGIWNRGMADTYCFKGHNSCGNTCNDQQFPGNFCRLCNLCSNHCFPLLYKARKNGSKSFSGGSNKIYRVCQCEEKAPQLAWSKGLSDGICQSGKKQKENSSCCDIPGTFGNTFECTLFFCGWL